MKEQVINVSVLAGSLVLAIAAGEIIVRKFGRVTMSSSQQVTDSLITYRLKPNVRGHAIHPGVLEYRWTTNSQQLRATREYSIAKPAGTRRVAALGDSFTFGLGVNDDETYPAVLQARLRTGCPDTVEVINFGVGGYGLSQELELFERYAAPFAPDVVVYQFYSNDIADNVQFAVHRLDGDSLVVRTPDERPQLMGAKRLTEKIPGYPWLVTHSALLNGVRQVYFGLKRRSDARAALGTSNEQESWFRAQNLDAPEWHLQRALMKRMRQRVEGSGAEFLVVLMAEQVSVELYYDGQPEKAAMQYGMRQLCEELAMPCIDHSEYVRANVPRAELPTLYHQGDGHQTALGQATTVGAIEPKVREYLGCSVS